MQIFKGIEVQENIGLEFIHYILFVIVQVHEHKPELLESTSLYRSAVQNLKKRMEIWAMEVEGPWLWGSCGLQSILE